MAKRNHQGFSCTQLGLVDVQIKMSLGKGILENEITEELLVSC